MKKDILKKIKKYDSIVIFGHINPDGDCYGSQMGLKQAIKCTFPMKQVYCVGSGFKPGLDLFIPMDIVSDEIIANSLCVGVDFNNIERSEDKRIGNGLDLVMIDHHMIGKPFGSAQIIETSSIAASQIIAKAIKAWHLKINMLGASCLFMGIVTDSGRFQYSPTNGETFNICSWLMSYGIDLKTMFDRLYMTEEDQLKFKGYVYSHFEKTEHGVIYCKLTKTALKKFHMSGHTGAVFVNLLGNVKDCPIWVFFGEDTDGKIFVEYRSSGINVQQIAVQYGGGGHQCAAGCNVPSMEIVDEILAKLDQLIVGEKK